MLRFVLILLVFTKGLFGMDTFMMDGSTLTFSDTRPLFDNYEGQIDIVPTGSNAIYKGLQSAEAEWVIVADLFFTGNENENDFITLHGMAEGKDFKAFEQDQSRWCPASLENNVMTDGPGIRMTIGEAQQGFDGAVKVEYQAQDESISFISTGLDLKGVDLLRIIKSVAKEYPNTAVRAINLGAIGKNAAFVNNTTLRVTAALPSFPWLYYGVHEFKKRVLKNIARSIIRKKRYALYDIFVTLVHEEKEIGKGVLFNEIPNL